MGSIVDVSGCCTTNAACGGRRGVSSSISFQIHQDLYAGSTYAFPGGLVLVGEEALMREVSLDLRIRLQLVPAWEKFHP